MKKFRPRMAWGFKLLAPLKVLRGTALDPFGRTEERRLERALIASYQATLASYLNNLGPGNAADALAFAKLPEQIRGFGHVKARDIAAVRGQWEGLGGEFVGLSERAHSRHGGPGRCAARFGAL